MRYAIFFVSIILNLHTIVTTAYKFDFFIFYICCLWQFLGLNLLGRCVFWNNHYEQKSEIIKSWFKQNIWTPNHQNISNQSIQKLKTTGLSVTMFTYQSRVNTSQCCPKTPFSKMPQKRMVDAMITQRNVSVNAFQSSNLQHLSTTFHSRCPSAQPTTTEQIYQKEMLVSKAKVSMRFNSCIWFVPSWLHGCIRKIIGEVANVRGVNNSH